MSTMISHYQFPVTVNPEYVFKSIPIDHNFADIRIKWSCFLYNILENPAHEQEKQLCCWMKSSFVLLF